MTAAASDGFATAVRLVELLTSRDETLATAESLTGGGVGSLVTSAPGASVVYVGGVISYATEVKVSLLGVSPETVSRHGVVSAECAAEMARGAASRLGATYGLSTTGVAGPEAQEGKPVGLVYVAVAGPGGVDTAELHLDGDRAAIQAAACEAAVEQALRLLSRE
jgi:nicotinamide-nucleotide amidase